MVKYERSGPVVHFRPHRPMIENITGPEHTRMYMFIRTPIIMSYPFACPYQIAVDMSDMVINKILMPLTDEQKLDFLWRLSRVITDGIRQRPSVIIFYGPDGHEGKGTLATNIKRWTSDAPVSNGNRTAFFSQSIIGITNKLKFLERSAINNSIGRRLIIYHMKKRMGKETPIPNRLLTNKVLLKFRLPVHSRRECLRELAHLSEHRHVHPLPQEHQQRDGGYRPRPGQFKRTVHGGNLCYGHEGGCQREEAVCSICGSLAPLGEGD